jgi:hypothetical protein
MNIEIYDLRYYDKNTNEWVPFYIGKSIAPKRREGEHIRDAKNLKHTEEKYDFIRELNKYGFEWKLQVIDKPIEQSEDDLTYYEAWYVVKYIREGHYLTNMKQGDAMKIATSPAAQDLAIDSPMALKDAVIKRNAQDELERAERARIKAEEEAKSDILRKKLLADAKLNQLRTANTQIETQEKYDYIERVNQELKKARINNNQVYGLGYYEESRKRIIEQERAAQLEQENAERERIMKIVYKALTEYRNRKKQGEQNGIRIITEI